MCNTEMKSNWNFRVQSIRVYREQDPEESYCFTKLPLPLCVVSLQAPVIAFQANKFAFILS